MAFLIVCDLARKLSVPLKSTEEVELSLEYDSRASISSNANDFIAGEKQRSLRSGGEDCLIALAQECAYRTPGYPVAYHPSVVFKILHFIPGICV
jgi:hypothetical protein